MSYINYTTVNTYFNQLPFRKEKHNIEPAATATKNKLGRIVPKMGTDERDCKSVDKFRFSNCSELRDFYDRAVI